MSTRRWRAAGGALLAALALAACGGTKVSETTPKNTPEITPPNDTSAEKAAGTSTLRDDHKKTSTSSESDGEASSSESESAAARKPPVNPPANPDASGGASAGGEKGSSETGASKEEGSSSPTGGASAP